uniref:hypothetical protein n=1 Tax=Neisseria leonii TaxID=2995413 RepID=UPI003F58DE67
MKLKILFPIFTLSLCTFTRADLPLSLEDILTDKGKVKLESSIAYVNSERSKNQFANPIYIQIKQIFTAAQAICGAAAANLTVQAA